MDKYCAVIEFPAMRVGIRTRNETLETIHYLPSSAPLGEPSSRFAERVVRQLERYRDDPDARFDLPLAIEGTPFQRRVWTALGEIGFGETMTYGDLAQRVGAPTAARAVGAAVGRNPISIIVPCHRAVGADGSLTGFAGGLARKRWLLEHEQAVRAQGFERKASAGRCLVAGK